MAAPDPLRVLAWPADANRTGNPYNARLSQGLRALGVTVDEFTPARLLAGGYDVWHAHWPDGAMGQGGAPRAAGGAGAILALAALARLRGVRIMWTVHNLRAHRRIAGWVERPFWRAWARMVDASIHLGDSAREQAMNAFPALRRRPAFVIPHPHYRLDYPSPPSTQLAREALGLPVEATVLGFVGHVRAYKSVTTLVGAFKALPGEDLRLLIAGRPESDAMRVDLQEAAAADRRILLELDMLPADRLPGVISALDLVVLPYADLLNSGAALLALSFDTPVLVPNRGTMADLRDSVGSQWVRLYDGALDPHSLQMVVDWLRANPARGPAPLDAFEPLSVAMETLAAYRAVTSDRTR